MCIGHNIEEEQPWVTLPGWTCRWKRPPSASVDDAGRIVREARAASEPEALVAFFGACGVTMERIGLEACSLTAWLHAGLTEAGLPAICIEARQAKAAMGAMPNKTDRNEPAESRRSCARAGIARCT